MRISEALLEWSRHTSNHGLPKISQLKCEKLRFLWIILFISSSIYCVYGIIGDFTFYRKFRTRTIVNVVNELTAQIPTLSICVYPINIEYMNETLIIEDCEIKQSSYLTSQKCSFSNFYKSSNYCLTLNASSGLDFNVTDQISQLGIKIEISKITLYPIKYVLFHEMDNMPLLPYTDKHHLPLIRCRNSFNESLTVHTSISYNIKQRNYYHKLSYPYSNCVENWNSISNKITRPAVLSNLGALNLNSAYDEENCFFRCLKVYENATEICSSLCPSKCNSITYLTSETSFCDHVNDTDYKTTISLSFDDIRYIDVQEVPAMTYMQLLASIG